MNHAKVVLIGGTSGAGKSTLGRALAERLGVTSLSIDDLHAAAKAVTTPDSHPGLHVMSTGDHLHYFTWSTVEQLKADTTTQHEATWPAIEKVIRNHATWGAPIVIDGWAMRPERVALLDLPEVASFWLVAEPNVLEARERKNVGFTHGSTEPERMFQNFLARSLWFNELISEQAATLGLSVLHQDGEVSVKDLCMKVMQELGTRD